MFFAVLFITNGFAKSPFKDKRFSKTKGTIDSEFRGFSTTVMNLNFFVFLSDKEKNNKIYIVQPIGCQEIEFDLTCIDFCAQVCVPDDWTWSQFNAYVGMEQGLLEYSNCDDPGNCCIV
jgi:hypothetical protein